MTPRRAYTSPPPPIRLYVVGTNPIYGPDGEMTGEILVNSTTAGDQRYPSVSMDDTGDAVVVWSGNGTGDSQGVFFQRFAKATDDIGPLVIETDYIKGTSEEAPSSSTTATPSSDTLVVSQLVVTLNEGVDASTRPNSIRNLANWSLSKNGTTVAGAIVSVTYDPIHPPSHRHAQRAVDRWVVRSDPLQQRRGYLRQQARRQQRRDRPAETTTSPSTSRRRSSP